MREPSREKSRRGSIKRLSSVEKKQAEEGARRYFEDGRFIPALLAEEIMKIEQFLTDRITDEIYVYLDGVYKPIGESVITEYCQRALGKEFRKNRAAEVIAYIRASTYGFFYEPDPSFINLRNGILDLKTGELLHHSPSFKFLSKIPVIYDPKAECPNILEFLDQVTGNPEDRETLIEFTGYCLWRGYPIQKALMLVGEGNNGKSTFLNLVREFLGRDNVSCVSLQDIVEQRFAIANLYGKLANIYADLPDRALRQTGMFKMLTGGDAITAEKKFKNPFTFTNYAKLMFSCNRLPMSLDDTDAFFRRWLIVVFPNQFEGDKADPNILRKLTTHDELSGLLNLALERLKRLLERNRFTISPTTEELREEYMRKSNPIGAFMTECVKADPEGVIVKKELYSLFCEYCRRNKLPAVNQDTFFKAVPKYYNVAETRLNRPDIEGRPRAFTGIALTEAGEALKAEIELRSTQSKQSTPLSIK